MKSAATNARGEHIPAPLAAAFCLRPGRPALAILA